MNKKTKVVIVGNSNNVTNYKFGPIIDKFDIVVRFNEFKINGFEEYVGTKTDYVAITPVIINSIKNLKGYTILTTSAYTNFISKDIDISKYNLEFYTHTDMGMYPEQPKPGTIPSTGFHIINHFNSSEYDLYIHGIGDGDAHYWNNLHEMWEGHDLCWEKNIINEMKIKRLVDIPLNSRNDFVNLLNLFNLNNNWVELGVATGGFNHILVKSGRATVWGIDRWSDHHDLKEYVSAINLLNPYTNSKLLRASFEEALHLFEDNFFDFIYIDGYAHTGQNGGETLTSWYPKLKNGGILAGHDYAPPWEENIKVVNEFLSKNSLNLNLIGKGVDKYPSWWTIKP